jgi:hypothetical protein
VDRFLFWETSRRFKCLIDQTNFRTKKSPTKSASKNGGLQQEKNMFLCNFATFSNKLIAICGGACPFVGIQISDRQNVDIYT